MVVYIPNIIYKYCKKEDESIEGFVKTVFKEWYEDHFVHNKIVEEGIKSICIIEDKFGT